MSESLEQLVDAAAAEVEGARGRLAAALEREPTATLALLARHRGSEVRAAVARNLPGRPDADAHGLAALLAKDAVPEVRKALSEALSHADGWGDDELYRALLDDEAWQVRFDVVAGACRRESLRDEVLIALVEDSDEDVRARIAALLAELDPVRALPGLIENLAVPMAGAQRGAAIALAEIVKRHDGFPSVVALPAREVVQKGATNLRAFGRRKFARVLQELDKRIADAASIELPGGRGTDLTREARQGKLERAFGVERHVDALVAVLERPNARAAVLVGESGVGKTAIVHALVQRLASDPKGAWLVVRMSPSEFLVGTKYLGEWQTELQKLVEALGTTKRAVLYVPAVHELAQIGRWEKGDENVAAMLAPHIESGRIALIGETTPEEFAAGLGQEPSVRRAWTTIEVAPATREQTLAVLRGIAGEAGATLSDALLERAIEYSEMFLASTAQPGRCAGLLRRLLARKDSDGLALRDVLEELSRSTGVPVDLLDDETALDLDALRAFFEARVMGQREAVDAVLDLVTLIKAGLTDPQKPLAVLFFVGPTGVGKTELARALAERIFGDPARLARFDMSEFASYESYERLIGAKRSAGLLTSAVRERPFSVVLLDEIEKAHTNVFDLCLQLFDAGRLTDGGGRTVDFRRSIVILTSNVGAAVASEGRLGFADSGPRAPEEDEVLRALRQAFRPEFLNRIDRIVCFRPLELDTAERIARRELARVLQRGGIERRGLALDVDPELVALLLRHGYSQAFGARPLKRTIERLVLMPVARAIASGAAQPGSVLRLAAAGERCEVRIVKAAPAVAPAPKPSASSKRLRERCAEVAQRVDELARSSVRLAERKSALVAASNAPRFWDDRAQAPRTLDELHRIDAQLGRLESLGRRMRATSEQVSRARDARATSELEARVDELACEERLLGRLARSTDARDLGDAWIVLARVKAQSDELAGVEKLARMYVAWARRRGLEVEVASDRRGGDPREDVIALALRGAGAFGLLRGESGLHVVQSEVAHARKRGAKVAVREVVRVDVLAAVDEPGERRRGVEAHKLSGVRGRLVAAPTLEVRALHRPSATALVLWTDREHDEALEQAAALLAATLAARAGSKSAAPEQIVRRYELAPTPRVRDSRVDAPPKLHRVLEGELDALL